MKVDNEMLSDDEGFTTVVIDVADVLTQAMEQDPRRLASLIAEFMGRESITLRTLLTNQQKKDLRDVVEVISHV